MTRHCFRCETPSARHLPVAVVVHLTATVCLVIALACASGARAADTPSYPQGAAAFQGNCALCHGTAGAGVAGLAPPLTAYPARYAATPEGRRQLAMTLLYGMFGAISVGEARFNSQMPDFGRLDDATLAATLNFVVFDLAHASADVKPLTAAEIASERSHPVDAAAVRAHRQSLPAPGS